MEKKPKGGVRRAGGMSGRGHGLEVENEERGGLCPVSFAAFL